MKRESRKIFHLKAKLREKGIQLKNNFSVVAFSSFIAQGGFHPPTTRTTSAKKKKRMELINKGKWFVLLAMLAVALCQEVAWQPKGWNNLHVR